MESAWRSVSEAADLSGGDAREWSCNWIRRRKGRRTALGVEHDLADDETAAGVARDVGAALCYPLEQTFARCFPDFRRARRFFLFARLGADGVRLGERHDLRRGEVSARAWGD